MQTNNHNKCKKRELHPLGIIAILFFFGFFVAIIIVNNSPKTNQDHKLTEDSSQNQVTSDEIGQQGSDSSEAKGILVAIDSGHGGNDPGKVSGDGILEKDVNLQIAFLLEKELAGRGIECIMLRQEDVNLATEGATNKKSSDMKNRVALINEGGADLLISIHQNSYTDPSVRGPHVFYHSASKESEKIAELLQDKLNNINPDHAREAKTGNDYYILHKSLCPGVIVECGFLSCPEEVALLTSPDYQQKIASAIADAIEETY